MRLVPSLALLLLLGGCATPAQFAEEVKQAYGPYCDSLGYQRDTDPWRQCIQLEDAKHVASQNSMFLMTQPGRVCRRGRYC